jgi:hypothetical protein
VGYLNHRLAGPAHRCSLVCLLPLGQVPSEQCTTAPHQGLSHPPTLPFAPHHDQIILPSSSSSQLRDGVTMVPTCSTDPRTVQDGAMAECLRPSKSETFNRVRREATRAASPLVSNDIAVLSAPASRNRELAPSPGGPSTSPRRCLGQIKRRL